jgi:hypothetical protein
MTDIGELADLLLSKVDGYAASPLCPKTEVEHLVENLRRHFGENVAVLSDGRIEVCGKAIATEDATALVAEMEGRA